MASGYCDSKDPTAEKCERYFSQDFNCCESILKGFSEQLHIDTGIIPRIATPFGGGISNRKYMCGALTGAIMVLGIKYGRDDSTQERDPSYSRTDRLVEKFVGKYGTVNCTELTGFDPNDPESIDRNKERVRNTVCIPILRQVSQWLKEEL
ncbi:MAG: hypothetical protein HPY66_0931 [Firmicutes bacterium]|nr:hypothetical protein [Bacillota bacterium]